MYKNGKETVELHVDFKGKIAKSNTRKVFASQANHETCFVTVGVPKVRLSTQAREDRCLCRPVCLSRIAAHAIF